jgi:hypothetical protein
MTYTPEIIEPIPSISDSFSVHGLQQAQVPVRAPVTAPQIPQQISHPSAASSFDISMSNQPGFPISVPNGSGANLRGCSNCSGSRQVISPSISAPKNLGVPIPPIISSGATQASMGVANGPPFPSAAIPNGLPFPVQPRMVNGQSSIPPNSLPPLGPFAQGQRIESTWKDNSLDPFERASMVPTMQRATPNAPPPMNPMFPNISPYELLELNQKPVNPGPPPSRYPFIGPNYMNNAMPQSVPINNSYGLGRQGVSNGPYGPQSLVPMNQPFPAVMAAHPPPRPAYVAAPSYPQSAPKPKEDTDLATQLGYLSINFENDTNSITSRLTSRYLHEVYDDLNGLATQISATTKPFDTTPTILAQVVQRYNLAHPNEWSLSVRTHSCTLPFPFSPKD